MNKKEFTEPINMTIGRLRTALRYGTYNRQRELLDKITDYINNPKITETDYYDLWEQENPIEGIHYVA